MTDQQARPDGAPPPAAGNHASAAARRLELARLAAARKVHAEQEPERDHAPMD